jgi:cytidyltransferase-like protein
MFPLKKKKVLVSGCFDLLHAGHIAFFREASTYGDLYVSVGSDENLRLLKGKTPMFSQEERVYIVKSIRSVKDAFVGSGAGLLDFEPELRRIQPDRFVVNGDGHSPEKEALCRRHGVEYIVLERVPEPGLPARSSSETKRNLRFPYRLCLAGGWIDQPWVSSVHPGSVVVARIRPTLEFNDRSGLATSSRRVALELWGDRIPDGDPVRNARLLFGAENPPGTKYVSGSQDHLGLLLPGINRLYYDGSYWPSRIDSTVERDVCNWLSDVLHLIPLEPRPEGYDPLEVNKIRKEWVKALGESGDRCWESILRCDVKGLGEAMSESFRMWRNLLPRTVPDRVLEEVAGYSRHPGMITSGSGGGYIMVASEEAIEGEIKVKIQR